MKVKILEHVFHNNNNSCNIEDLLREREKYW